MYPAFYESVSPEKRRNGAGLATSHDSPTRNLLFPARFQPQNKDVFRTQEQGADTIVWLCAAPDDALDRQASGLGSGKFWLDRRVEQEHLSLSFTAMSEDDEVKLWEETSALCGWQ